MMKRSRRQMPLLAQLQLCRQLALIRRHKWQMHCWWPRAQMDAQRCRSWHGSCCWQVCTAQMHLKHPQCAAMPFHVPCAALMGAPASMFPVMHFHTALLFGTFSRLTFAVRLWATASWQGGVPSHRVPYLTGNQSSPVQDQTQNASATILITSHTAHLIPPAIVLDEKITACAGA